MIPALKGWRPIYYSLAGFFLIAGLASGERPFFVLFLAQILLSLLALLVNLYAAWTFSFLQQTSASQVQHGDRVHLQLQIHNEKVLPYPLLRIRINQAEDPEPARLEFNLAPHSQRDFDVPLHCPYRGRYPVGMTVIDFIDCFNLVRLPFDLRHLPYYRMPELLVLPGFETGVTLEGQAQARQAAAHLARPSNDNSEPYATVRPYQPGDSRREIHWKASLRQQTLLTRQYGQAIEPQVLLILDFSQPAWSGRLAWQAADALCSAACTLLHAYLSQQIPVRLISNQGPHLVESRTAQSLQDFESLRTWLGGMSFSAPVPLADLLRKGHALFESARTIYLLTTAHEKASIDPILPLLARQNRPDRPCHVILALPETAEKGAAVFAANPNFDSKVGGSLFRQNGLKVLVYRYGQPWAEQVKA